MHTGVDPNGRRITWLIIGIGAAATLIALVYALLNLGPGIALPFARTPLDVGWLLVFGLMWLVVGLLLLWWLRSTPGESETNGQLQELDKRLTQRVAQLQAAQESRLDALDLHLKNVESRLDSVTGLPTRLNDLDHELDTLATTIQDAHTRIDKLGDANNLLHDLDSQLDTLYVTLQEIHRRLDSLEENER